MCFSAQASFTAAVLLAGIGTATVRKAPTKAFLPLALIPSFFALQQFSEGILWMKLSGAPLGWMSEVAPAAFIFFALIVWPVWIPFSLWCLEMNLIKKWVIAALGGMGILISLYYALMLPFSNYEISIVNHSIQYSSSDVHDWKWLYVIVILGSIFLSSVRGMWVYGLVQIATIGIAYYAYTYAFVSVWCFFAAIVSIAILGILYLQPSEKAN